MRVSVLTILMAFLFAAGVLLGATAGLAQDTDGDTVPDGVDNCRFVPNGAIGEPPGALVPQCDTDGDGYGNACDADVNNDGVIGAPDFAGPIGLFGTFGYPVWADVNCDGGVGGPDFGPITWCLLLSPPCP